MANDDKKSKDGENIRYIVRIKNTDIEGTRTLLHGITKVKGMSVMFANAVCAIAKIDPSKKIGLLSDAEIERLKEIVDNPLDSGIPAWILNRRADPESGNDKHLFSSDLDFAKQNDIKAVQKLKSYKGLRHAKRLTVRGQRTKANFRRNKNRRSTK